MTANSANKNLLLRSLPSVDELLRASETRPWRERLGHERLASLAREVTAELRAQLQADTYGFESANGEGARQSLIAEAVRRLLSACERDVRSGLQRVINATGVILHTNLGRAPLSEAARLAVAGEAARYCALEYDTEAGARGRRGARVEQLLAELTGAESAIVVNNCAAAALLVLAVLARGGSTIVSRGELVEIGGDFRVPEVMAQSGTRLVEVGTTNRTRLSDYERAIDMETRLIMRVHTSNYRIIGFTAAPSLKELAQLAHESDLLLYEDAGSGALLDMKAYGLEGEPLIKESVKDGADVITFSGDKLLGACQAGLIVGRAEIIERLRRHPLYRAMRADKMVLSVLQATLESYRRGAAMEEIPVLRMLSLSGEELEERSRSFLSRLRQRLGHQSIQFEIFEGESAVGGGAAPAAQLRTALIAIKHGSLSADALDHRLRSSAPPIIARTHEGKVLLDLRTVSADEEAELLEALATLQA